jgi:hypothetical protein
VVLADSRAQNGALNRAAEGVGVRARGSVRWGIRAVPDSCASLRQTRTGGRG